MGVSVYVVLFVNKGVVFKGSQKLEVYLRLSSQPSLPGTNKYLKKKKLTVKMKLQTHIHSNKRTHRWEKFVFRILRYLLLAIPFIHT